MLILFLKERCSWILFIVLFLLCINLLFYLDEGFSEISVSYFNIVTITVFISFLIWRYVKETRLLNNFLGNLSNRIDLLFPENISLSPFQRKYIEEMRDIIENKELLLNESKVQLQEDKEDLLAWVHEMKTPLTAMKLVIEQVENVKVRKKLENEWMRIHLLLDQQLHSTRLASIEKDNRLEKVELRPIVYKEIKDFQSWCIEKGIGFEIDGLEEVVVSDKKWLAFIVRQILSNAIKYSHNNSEIKIFTETNEKGTQLHFQDYGLGIPQEDLPRIFNKSYTGTIGRESVQSTGMGLYLAKNAAQKLGIQILVRSSVNEGSCFTLQFPNQNEYQNVLGR